MTSLCDIMLGEQPRTGRYRPATALDPLLHHRDDRPLLAFTLSPTMISASGAEHQPGTVEFNDQQEGFYQSDAPASTPSSTGPRRAVRLETISASAEHDRRWTRRSGTRSPAGSRTPSRTPGWHRSVRRLHRLALAAAKRSGRSVRFFPLADDEGRGSRARLIHPPTSAHTSTTRLGVDLLPSSRARWRNARAGGFARRGAVERIEASSRASASSRPAARGSRPILYLATASAPFAGVVAGSRRSRPLAARGMATGTRPRVCSWDTSQLDRSKQARPVGLRSRRSRRSGRRWARVRLQVNLVQHLAAPFNRSRQAGQPRLRAFGRGRCADNGSAVVHLAELFLARRGRPSTRSKDFALLGARGGRRTPPSA